MRRIQGRNEKNRAARKSRPGELPEAASACQKSLFDTLVDGGASYPQFAMVGSLRSQSSLAALPCLLGLLRAASPTGRALRAPPLEKGSLLDSGATV